MGQSASLVHDVSIDAMRKATLTTEAPWLCALGQDLLLELGAVAPTGIVLGFSHDVHLSRLVDTIVTA